MLTFRQAIDVVADERAYQDSAYNPNQEMASGLTRAQRDLDVTSHILLLDEYVDKAKKAWVPKGSNLQALQAIAKVAAIAVRVLERAAGSEVLPELGLR